MNRVTLVLPKLTAGGTERTAVELANYLNLQNVEVSVVLMFKREIFFTLNEGISLIEPSWNPRSFIGRHLYWFYLIYYLRHTIIKSRPDSVLLLGYILIGLIVTVGKKYKIFFSNRTNPTRPRFGKSTTLNYSYDLLYRILRSKVHGIIAQTEIAREYYSTKFNCHIKVIPNSLKKMTYFEGIVKEDVVISIGRAVPEKGQIHFIDLVSVLSPQYPSLKFILIGDGPELVGLKKYAVKLGIADNIEFLGFKADVDFYLARSKYFVLTSITEGYPNVLIEAMAHGCVPFSFDCVAGPSDIISHQQNGYLVNVGDVKTMADYISQIIQDSSLFHVISQKAIMVRESNNSDLLNKEWMNFIID